MLDACREEIRNCQIKGVFGSPTFGFHEVTLEALRNLRQLEAVWFWDVELKSIDALYELSALQYFGVHPKRPAIDFARFPLLKNLIWTPKVTYTGVGSLKHLNLLHVWHYAPKTKSFSELQLPKQLIELKVMWANPKTLQGLAGIAGLRRLEIHRCRNLESLALVPELFPNLEHLVVDACGRIPDGEGARIAAQMPSLRLAVVARKKVV